MSDAVRRALRGFIQVGVVSAAIGLAAAFNWIQWSEEQTVAVIAVATPIVTFIQNFFEDKGVVLPLVPSKGPATEQQLQPH